MVSQTPAAAAAPSRSRLIAAAAAEFAARGFDGAKVDRIARHARLNKAMLYYHFRSKADLYRAILRDLFGSLAVRVAAVRDGNDTPTEQLRRYIHALAEESARAPHFPAIWLREMAEGGRHLDAGVTASLAAVVGVLAAILRDGRDAGEFREVPPFIVQMGIAAPLILFAASAPLRERVSKLTSAPFAGLSRDAVIAHVERATLEALRPAGPSIPSPTPRRRSAV